MNIMLARPTTVSDTTNTVSADESLIAMTSSDWFSLLRRAALAEAQVQAVEALLSGSTEVSSTAIRTALASVEDNEE